MDTPVITNTPASVAPGVIEGQGDMFAPPPVFTPHPDHLSPGEDDEDFDWFANESIIVDTQEAVAVYTNPRDHVVIRRERREYERDDMFIVLSTREALRALIASLQEHERNWER